MDITIVFLRVAGPILAFVLSVAFAALGRRVGVDLAHRSARPWVWGLAVTYFLAFAVISLLRHRAFATNSFDLGYYVNLIYQFGHGRFFVQTVLPSENFRPLLFAPMCAFFFFLAYIPRTAECLLLLQSFSLAAGIVLICDSVGGTGARRWAGAALAASYAFTPALHGANFHAGISRTFAVPFVLAAYYLFFRRCFWPGVFFTALAALCREDLAMHAVGLALFGGWVTGRTRAGLTVAAALALYFLGVGLFLYPRLTQPAAGAPYYIGFADIRTIMRLRAPGQVVIAALKVGYISALCLPVVFFLRRARAALVTIVTPLAVPVFAAKGVIFAIGSQYAAGALPFIYGAAAWGVINTYHMPAGDGKSRSAVFPSLTALAMSVILMLLFAGRLYRPVLRQIRFGAREAALAAAVKRVPPDIPLSASEHLLPHLARRPYIYLFPEAAGYELPIKPEALLAEIEDGMDGSSAGVYAAAAAWGLAPRTEAGYYVYFSENGSPAARRDRAAGRARSP